MRKEDNDIESRSIQVISATYDQYESGFEDDMAILNSICRPN